MKKWNRRDLRSGRWTQDRRLYGYFLACAGIGFILMMSFIGINTIVKKIQDKIRDFGKVVIVENAFAEVTWQEKVIEMLKEAGIDTKYANKVIVCESSWRPSAVHYNKGSVDYGLWQMNNIHQPQVSKSCALDPICATYEAIQIIKSKGWRTWSCVTKGLI